jgi:hypothetical protein
MPYPALEMLARQLQLCAAQKTRASTVVDARAVFRSKSQFIEDPI